MCWWVSSGEVTSARRQPGGNLVSTTSVLVMAMTISPKLYMRWAARLVCLRRVSFLKMDKLFPKNLGIGVPEGSLIGATTGVLCMNEPLLKAVKRRSIFLQPFYLQGDRKCGEDPELSRNVVCPAIPNTVNSPSAFAASAALEISSTLSLICPGSISGVGRNTVGRSSRFVPSVRPRNERRPWLRNWKKR